jgi:hypothetical protein
MRRLLLLLLLLSLPLFAGKKKGMGVMYRKSGQKVEIANAAASLSTAHKKCENYAWAAIVETMMHVQQVGLKQEDWAVRTSHGDRCYPSLDDYAQRADALGGDYTLDGGRKVRIHADYAAPQPAAMIYSLQLGRPLMVVWQGRPYLLYGMVYDELIHSSGKANDFVVREIHLLDAALAQNDPKRLVVVKQDGDDDAMITGLAGVMSVSVEARNFYDLPVK